MTTKIIGIKEYRQNITTLWKEAREKNIKYIVMYHSKPVFEVSPLQDEDELIELLKKDIKEARAQAKNGETTSHEDLMAEFGIK
ncbi:hypothetical protein COU74_05345 [Candidatus Peregrinibacteria bacterium CG10_big_fil_rev_8_21_14_0_10_36_19]|nr:MAG: hypothetical protein COU74_05345 [Candidatus Peregrinibacteria bacterium CG10_big_fil_rev_8_21_14_0_10_36_19]